jgi:glycosidase
MKLSSYISAFVGLAGLTSATILQNGQVRITNYPDTKVNLKDYNFKTYPAGAPEISYKGRWDSKFISYWSAPGIKFGFTGNQVALTLGPNTIDTTLVAYRISGQDWQFTNVTSKATHLLVNAKTPAVELTAPINPKTFELRVTNWEYGIQIDKVRHSHFTMDAMRD